MRLYFYFFCSFDVIVRRFAHVSRYPFSEASFCIVIYSSFFLVLIPWEGLSNSERRKAPKHDSRGCGMHCEISSVSCSGRLVKSVAGRMLQRANETETLVFSRFFNFAKRKVPQFAAAKKRSRSRRCANSASFGYRLKTSRRRVPSG